MLLWGCWSECSQRSVWVDRGELGGDQRAFNCIKSPGKPHQLLSLKFMAEQQEGNV